MRSLQVKLIIAFLAVSLVGTVLSGVYIREVTTAEFNLFLVAQSRTNIVDRLAEVYATNKGWEGFRIEQLRWPPQELPSGTPTGISRDWGASVPGDHVTVADTDRRIVLGGRGYRLGQMVSREEYDIGIPITVEGREVGRLLLGYQPSILNRPFDRFLGRFYLALALGGLGGTGIALLLGVLLARSMTSPLRELTRAAQAMSRGDLEQRITVRSDDELGELARAFNQLSEELVQAQQLRRQMSADVAHELRTPLSLILGHAEGLADGVLEPTEETFEVVHDEARRLSRLVDDLHTLSLADAGELSLQREPTAPAALLRTTVAAQRPAAEVRGVNLTMDVQEDLPLVDVDPDRLVQVLHNLVSNALRYTPQDGRIELSAFSGESGWVTITVRDTGPGIPEEDLPHVFERFYRGDKARHRAEGGSGLGLAIARSIVEMQGGRIRAENGPGGGARFVIELPVAAADA